MGQCFELMVEDYLEYNEDVAQLMGQCFEHVAEDYFEYNEEIV